MLEDAARNNKKVDLMGFVTKGEAARVGATRAGLGWRFSTDGKAIVSADGLRIAARSRSKTRLDPKRSGQR
jgi:hypothetical protein